MNDRQLTGEALLYAMEGIPDDILERSEEAAYSRRPVYRRQHRWTVLAGRLAAAAAVLLLVLAGRNLLTWRLGSTNNSGTVSNSADYEEAKSMEYSADDGVRSEGAYGEPAESEEAAETEESADTTVMIGAAGAETGEEAGIAEDAPVVEKGLAGNTVTTERILHNTAARIAEACLQTVKSVKSH